MTTTAATLDLDRTLTTRRLELRPLDQTDVPALWPYVSDPDLPRFMTWEAHRDSGQTVEWVKGTIAARKQATGYVWTIRVGGALCGTIGLESILRVVGAWRHDRGELGYWLAPEHRNQGFVTEASREVLRFGFEELALHKVKVGCVAENVPSVRVIEKLGFRLVGCERSHFFRYDRWWDHLYFEMEADDWAAQSTDALPQR